MAEDTPRNLKLSRGKRTLLVTVKEQGRADQLTDVVLGMDNPSDQARLSDLLAQGCVISVHSQEPTLEEVFIEVAGIRPA